MQVHPPSAHQSPRQKLDRGGFRTTTAATATKSTANVIIFHAAGRVHVRRGARPAVRCSPATHRPQGTHCGTVLHPIWNHPCGHPAGGSGVGRGFYAKLISSRCEMYKQHCALRTHTFTTTFDPLLACLTRTRAKALLC